MVTGQKLAEELAQKTAQLNGAKADVVDLEAKLINAKRLADTLDGAVQMLRGLIKVSEADDVARVNEVARAAAERAAAEKPTE